MMAVEQPPTLSNINSNIYVYKYIYIVEAKGGAKASAPEWESGGQRGRKKNGALFGGSRTE